MPFKLSAGLVLGWIAMAGVPGLSAAEAAVEGLEPVRVSADGGRFVLAGSGRTFRVWGVNYDHDARGDGRLLEDYWVEEWETVREDFREIRDLGANVVRVHLQLGRFMESAESPNAAALNRLGKLVDLAETTGLYLDVTGLGCYHKQDVPGWYDDLGESERWEVQARFWRAVARACRGRAGVFCFDLMNEPVIGGNEAEGWLAGELGGKHFVQRLTLNRGDREAVDVAGAWVKRQTAAIREEDPDRLVTVGVIPWALVWPNARPVFYAPAVARHLDFVSVHFYPDQGEVDKALTALAVYDIGKPLVIEEMFPLKCTVEELDRFIRESESLVEGWISFYWGRTPAEYRALPEPTLAESLTAGWLEHFQRQSPARRLP